MTVLKWNKIEVDVASFFSFLCVCVKFLLLLLIKIKLKLKKYAIILVTYLNFNDKKNS